MDRFVSPLGVVCLGCVALAVSAPARAAISLGEISNRAPFDRGLVTHLVGTSVEGYEVDATFLQSGLDTSLPAINGLFQPGQSISLFGGITWSSNMNRGLTVDGASYPLGSPPYIFPTLTPTGDGVHGSAIDSGFFFLNGSVQAPAAPANPTVPQTVTVFAPFTYSDIDVMASLVNPRPAPGAPLLVEPLFSFDEAGGTGLAALELAWLPNLGPSGVWEGQNISYNLSSSVVPEPSSLFLWAIATAGLGCWAVARGLRRAASGRGSAGSPAGNRGAF